MLTPAISGSYRDGNERGRAAPVQDNPGAVDNVGAMVTGTPRHSFGTAVAILVLAAGCASAPPIGSRPAPFPGAPPQAWASRPALEPLRVSAVGPLLQAAVSLLGSPYRLGGTTPQSGFDCSGFVRYVFGQFSMEVPRTAAEQFRVGRDVAATSIARGDLIFFSTTGPGATHVGIVLDPDARTFVHAPGTGAVVRIERFDTPYWNSRTLGVRRLPIDAIPTADASTSTGDHY